jgi:hypothetical protein
MSDAARHATLWCADPPALDNRFVPRVDIDVGTSYLVGASPAQFDERVPGAVV